MVMSLIPLKRLVLRHERSSRNTKITASDGQAPRDAAAASHNGPLSILWQSTDGVPRPGLTASDGSAAANAVRPSDADISRCRELPRTSSRIFSGQRGLKSYLAARQSATVQMLLSHQML
jgi:hypothetical protein